MSNYKGSEKHILALNTFVKLVRCTNSVSGDVHSHFIKELTVSQFGILEALYHLGPMAQKELAVKILKSPGNITTIINNLVKDGLVAHVPGQSDRRYCTIELTEQGRATIERIFPVHAEKIYERLSVLSSKEQKILGGLLRKLAKPV